MMPRFVFPVWNHSHMPSGPNKRATFARNVSPLSSALRPRKLKPHLRSDETRSGRQPIRTLDTS
jgi:hypothetical protein